MTRREAEALLDAHDGKTMCVAYRTAADGTILHRPEPRTIARTLGVGVLALAACTGHAPDIEHPGEHCRDPQGYELDCDDARPGRAPVIPDADPRADETPVRPSIGDGERDADVAEPAPVAGGPTSPPSTEVYDIDGALVDDDGTVGLVAVDVDYDARAHDMTADERVVGELEVDASSRRRYAREARRAARRERRAGR